MAGWGGRACAIISVIGFFAVLFTYFGVNYLLPGLHSYV
jgi:ABC-type transport system involved in cytochrome c biogenesis permease subunit